MSAKLRAVHDGVASGAMAFMIVYALPWYYDVVQLWYQPLLHIWSFGGRPLGLTMDWFGRNANAALIGAIAAAVGYAIGRKRSAPPGPIWSWSIAATFIIVVGIYVAHLSDRVPTPEPFPSGYTPR